MRFNPSVKKENKKTNKLLWNFSELSFLFYCNNSVKRSHYGNLKNIYVQERKKMLVCYIFQLESHKNISSGKQKRIPEVRLKRIKIVAGEKDEKETMATCSVQPRSWKVAKPWRGGAFRHWNARGTREPRLASLSITCKKK